MVHQIIQKASPVLLNQDLRQKDAARSALTTPIAIAEEEAVEKVELRPVVPVMLKLGPHTKAQVYARHVCIELITRCTVEKIHVWYSNEV